MVQERIHRFNQENAPFYLVDHDGKNFSLCLALSFLPDEYEDFGQAAFNRYAEKIGEPISIIYAINKEKVKSASAHHICFLEN